MILSPKPVCLSPVVRNNLLYIKAPAKINWFLRILDKREDGYHNIVSLMQCVGLFDELTFDHSDSIIVENDMDIPVSDDLVYKAASLLKQYASYGKGARIKVKKRIPVGAGLGGGSSDAAWTMIGLNALWETGVRHDEMSSIASALGSDIPFFFESAAALVEGRGDRVSSLDIKPSFALLLVNPNVRISTAWAYNAFDECRGHTLTKTPVDIKLFCQALQRQDFPSLSRLLSNDFEDIVMREYPVVREIRQRLIEIGADAALMSGSGPTVFGVFRSVEGAKEASGAMKPNWCRVVKTLI